MSWLSWLILNKTDDMIYLSICSIEVVDKAIEDPLRSLYYCRFVFLIFEKDTSVIHMPLFICDLVSASLFLLRVFVSA